MFHIFRTGAARLTQIFLPLVRRANGRIVFVSSGKKITKKTPKRVEFFFFHSTCTVILALARVPAPIRGAQCATQAGIEQLAICLRQELRPRGVDVSIVAAGEFACGTAWLSEASMLEQVCELPLDIYRKIYFIKFLIVICVFFFMSIGSQYVESINCRTKGQLW